MTGPVLIVDQDRVRSAAHAAALRRLGRMSATTTGIEEGSIEAASELLLDAGDDVSWRDVRRLAGDLPIVLCCDDATLDIVGTAFGEVGIALLHHPATDADYATALATLRLSDDTVAGLADGDAGYALRLAALGEEIARIARAIEPPVPAPDASAVPEAPLTFDPALLRRFIKARRLRDSLFAPGTFADPAWDMLLDLAAARGEGKPVSISSLAIAAAAPTTTALRYMRAMIEAGLLVRRSDPDDRRRTYIDLSEDAFARMRAWVAGTAKAV